MSDGEVDLCTENPGKNVDLYIITTLRNIVDIWEGDMGLKTAQRKNLLTTQGNRKLARSMPDWLGINPYADIRRGDPMMMKIAVDRQKKAAVCQSQTLRLSHLCCTEEI